MFARLLTLPIWFAALASLPVLAQSQPAGLAKGRTPWQAAQC